MAPKSLRDRYTGVLMDRFNETRYPSTPMLDRIEASITDRDTAESYVSALLEHVEKEQFPSPSMLDRLNALIAYLEKIDNSHRS